MMQTIICGRKQVFISDGCKIHVTCLFDFMQTKIKVRSFNMNSEFNE